MNKVVIAIAMLLTLVSGTVMAAEFSHRGSTMLLDGEIKKGDHDRLQAIITEIFIEGTVSQQVFFYAINNQGNKDGAIYIKDGKINTQEGERVYEEIGESEKKDIELLRTAFGGLLQPKTLNLSTLNLNSIGGNAVEAMMIGESVRKSLLLTELDKPYSSNSSHSCSSACFFIWASGVKRKANTSWINPKKELGIHRTYFEPTEYSQYSGGEAIDRYSEAKSLVSNFLESKGVDKAIIEKSWKVPSNDMYFLNNKEKKLLTGYAPFYEELLISRCGAYEEEDRRLVSGCKYRYPIILANNKDDYGVYTYQSSGGETSQIFIPDSDRKKFLRTCPSIPPAKIEQLMSGYEDVDDCKRVHSSILRWEAVNSTFGITKKYPKLLGQPVEFYIDAYNNGWKLEQFR